MVSERILRRSRRLLLDTNAFIYFLGGEEPYLSTLLPLFRRVQAGELTVVASVVTEAELLVRPHRNGDMAAVERIGDLLSEDGIVVIDVDRRIARRAAALRGQTALKLPDAIIVATALETGCEAILGNDGEWAKKPIDIPYVRLRDI